MAKAKRVLKHTASSMQDWKRTLGQILTTASRKSNIAIVGVGHPLRGDDFIGSHIVKALQRQFGECPEGVNLFDAEESVETLISKVAGLDPKHVVFIDACEMNAPSGEIHLIPMAETEYPFFTTHGIPLKLLAEQFLPRCKAWVLAVQPDQVELRQYLSPQVNRSAKAVIEFITSLREERAIA